MKRLRLAGLIIVAALAITNALAAAVAWASPPEFSPGILDSFKSHGGVGVLETPSTSAIECASNASTGEVTGAKTVGSVVVTFRGCAINEDGGCVVGSVGATSGLIVTHTLKGELGSVKTTEALLGVGLLLEPTSGSEFAELEGACLFISPSPVAGSVAGAVSPTDGLSRTGKLVFGGNKGRESIKEINVLGIEKKPELTLDLQEVSESTVELVLYAAAVEVT